MTTHRSTAAAILALLGGAALQAPTATAQDGYYAGRDVELLVPFSAGGGNDSFARLLSGVFEGCLPGVSSVQVVNVPGGGTVIGANEFELMREPDGTTLLVTSGTTSYAWMLGQQGVRYSPKNWEPILGLPGGGVIYVDPETGVGSTEELVSTDAELVYGGLTPVGIDLLALLTFEILDIDPQVVMGYEGKAPARIAFEQGETNLDYQTTPGYIASVVPLVEAGEATPLYTLGHIEDGDLVRDPAFPDIASFKEAYQLARGGDPEGIAWDAYLALISSGVSAQRQVWVHGEAPAEAIQALKEAAQCVVESEALYEQGGDILAGYDPIVGERLETNVAAMTAVSDEVLGWLQDHVVEEYGVELGD